MDTVFQIIEIIIMAAFLIMLYRNFGKSPKIKIVKVPTVKQIKREKKRARRLRKIKRKFRIPYIGKTEMLPYDPKKAYIEAVWNEINGKK